MACFISWSWWRWRLTHGVAVGVVLQRVLPDEVGVGHELSHGDVFVLVDVGEQRGQVHGFPDDQQVVGHLQEAESESETGSVTWAFRNS